MARHKDNPPNDRNVLLCVTGGIACYKSADLAGKLVGQGFSVTVAMTEAAEKFIRPLTFQSLTDEPVFTSLWSASESYRCGHISLTERAELMIIAPATANIIAKLAVGLADDLVSTLALSAAGACPILIAPAMNTRMWNAPATKSNVATLTDRGVEFVGPEDGRLACGDVGIGRMAEPNEIIKAAIKLLAGNQ